MQKVYGASWGIHCHCRLLVEIKNSGPIWTLTKAKIQLISTMSHWDGHLGPSYALKKSSLMKWVSKFFKGSNQKISNGHHPRVISDENMVWRAPTGSGDGDRAKNEDLDHGLALPLADDLRKPTGCRRRAGNDEDYRRHADNDEDLARALQESLNMSPSYNPYTPHYYYPRGYRICAGCNSAVGYGRFLSCMGAVWHPQCFCCHACGEPISDPQFSLSGNDPYHKSCYKELHHPRCDVCREFIPINKAGLIEYRSHPFWQQKYCPSHEYDRTARCCSCERMEPRNVRYISLGDGRSLCLECLDSAVMDTGDCQPLYHAIRDYYEGMNMKLDQQIPMLMVERQALNEAMEGEKDGHRHMPETRGLCLSEEQTVSSILKRPMIGGNQLIGMKTQQQKLPRRCEVSAILVLYGLPRLLTGSILAHELMHGWLRLKGYRNLSLEVEEGICQVLSHMWLESEVMSGSSNTTYGPYSSYASSSSSSSYAPSYAYASSSYSSSSKKNMGNSDLEKKLGQFFMCQIASDSSPAYGGGFRAAYAAVTKYGLYATLEHMRRTGNFPV
ncbi:protein DA1-related 2 isoform X2 [Amborella trichopoda]|uniref:protein DA1-related 2 isoform X2 n=1 Tax=Amborella trichopoda TaxID=13333 RepID=UPI0009BD965D|nr:protein DA1-related 2 isoform X2 [Amborella trichopoda]|eukprot:XP_020526595.1 protein DA1-related 2 isoform X2 [Amborella trichopoda]